MTKPLKVIIDLTPQEISLVTELLARELELAGRASRPSVRFDSAAKEELQNFYDYFLDMDLEYNNEKYDAHKQPCCCCRNEGCY